MHYDIVALPKDQWKGTAIPLTTRSDSYYDLELSPLNYEGCSVSIVRKPAEKEIVHTPEEYDFPDSKISVFFFHCDNMKIGIAAKNTFGHKIHKSQTIIIFV